MSGEGRTQAYKTAKFFHLAGLVLWLGPSAGGYLLLLLSRFHHQVIIELWIFKEYVNLIHVEALGMAVLISSGLAMRSFAPTLRQAKWLKRKLFIVFLIFLPFELAQLYIYDMIVEKAFLTGQGIGDAMMLCDRFSAASFIFLAVTVPLVFWLAIFRPGSQLEQT